MTYELKKYFFNSSILKNSNLLDNMTEKKFSFNPLEIILSLFKNLYIFLFGIYIMYSIKTLTNNSSKKNQISNKKNFFLTLKM